jgi:hypothetical protein
MNPEAIKSFVTYYLQSLHERTRREKSGPKWGIDWVAYNIGLAKFGKPVRLPFLRSGDEGYPKTKVEAEFGIDVAFLSGDGRHLVIFVLKDEPLTNKNWTRNDFDGDLRRAMFPDLSADGLEDVASVTVILAYNKDDEQNGIELYDRLVSDAPTKLRDGLPLNFVRWNLAELVEQTIQNVLSPSLLPERFFGQLSYLAAQVADFTHGSDAWERQLIPNWKRFVDDVLQESGGARGPALIPVVLIILRQHAQNNPSFETGWIDLVEWAAIALWNVYAIRSGSSDRAVTDAIERFWTDFYIAEVDRFYRAHIEDLGTEQAIDQLARGAYVGAIAASHVAYWHLGRLGLLSLHLAELADSGDADMERSRRERLEEIANWTAMLANANVSVFRPVLDIQHIEIFLLVEAWRNAGRVAETAALLQNLQARLYLRRLGHSDLPFLDGANSFENVFEQLATRPKDSLVLSASSFFVLMLLELCCLLPDESRNTLIALIHRRLVLGALDQGDPGDRQPLDLMSWIPPTDWVQKVFRGDVEGESVAVPRFADSRDATAADILAGMRRVVAEMRTVSPIQLPAEIPLAAAILASLRYGTPLPPELWRRFAFPRTDESR